MLFHKFPQTINIFLIVLINIQIDILQCRHHSELFVIFKKSTIMSEISLETKLLENHACLEIAIAAIAADSNIIAAILKMTGIPKRVASTPAITAPKPAPKLNIVER